MKAQLSTVVAFLSGFIMILAFFSASPGIVNLSQNFLTWVTIVGGISLLLGIVSLLKVNFKAVREGDKDRIYKLILILFVTGMSLSGIIWGTEERTPYDWLFQKIQSPMMSTMFSLLAFFIASAAYRAFRARTVEATILLITAVIVMLGRTPLGQAIWGKLPSYADWIMAYPNLAVQRGIIIGAALGAAAMSLRILLGIERTYLS